MTITADEVIFHKICASDNIGTMIGRLDQGPNTTSIVRTPPPPHIFIFLSPVRLPPPPDGGSRKFGPGRRNRLVDSSCKPRNDTNMLYKDNSFLWTDSMKKQPYGTMVPVHLLFSGGFGLRALCQLGHLLTTGGGMTPLALGKSAPVPLRISNGIALNCSNVKGWGISCWPGSTKFD